MIWFTADYHLSHKNIIKYCNRPFENMESMNAVILDNLQKSAKSGDILYHLGDLTFRKDVAKSFFDDFNFLEIHYIIGNHDSEDIINIAREHCKSVSKLKDIKIENISITLCHYAMRVWNNSHFNSWQLYGHSHGTLIPIGKQYDVGVDSNNFFPVSFEKLKEIMKNKENNVNFLSQNKNV